MTAYAIQVYTYYAMFGCWFVFLLVMFWQKRKPKSTETCRVPKSWLGIVLQAVGFMFAWSFPRIFIVPAPEMSIPGATLLGIFCVTLCLCSILFIRWGMTTLGKQWALTARLVEGHQLIQEGPYKLVRHPIYAGLFGMLLAASFAIAPWWAILPAIVFYTAGAMIRINIEERLLREAFGAEFEAYAARVKGFIPFIL